MQFLKKIFQKIGCRLGILEENKINPLPIIDNETVEFLVKDAKLVDINEFILYMNNPNLTPIKFEIFAAKWGDFILVTFDNDEKIDILTSSFNLVSDNRNAAADLHKFMIENKARITGIEIIPLENNQYTINFKFEEMEKELLPVKLKRY